MAWRRKSAEKAQEPQYSFDEHVTMASASLLKYFEARREQGLSPVFRGEQLTVDAKGVASSMNLTSFVDEFDESALLVGVGSALAKSGANVDIGLVVEDRNNLGAATKIAVVITPEGVEPPYERKVLYPPNPEDQLPSVPYNRRGPNPDPSLAYGFIAADPGSIAKRNSMGL